MSPTLIANRFELSRLLGRGGMADVYLATDQRLGREVAVKMLHHNLVGDDELLARFAREAQSAGRLNHPSIVAVYDTGEHEVTIAGSSAKIPYIVMEYIRGITLRELLNRSASTGRPGLPPGYRIDQQATQVDGSSGSGRHLDPEATRQFSVQDSDPAPNGPVPPLAPEQAVELTTGVLAALVYSHRHGVIHRDIKPGNVMLTDNGDVKVMDFGIARAASEATAAMTRTNTVVGTAQYLSPEQARGETVDTRSDLYSTGCLLYELLTGRPPFVADSAVALAYKHVSEMPEPPSTHNPAIGESMDRVVMKALAKNADDRYGTAEQFRTDLLAAAAGHSVGAPALGSSGVGATTVMGTTGAPGSPAAMPAYGANPAAGGTDPTSVYPAQPAYGARPQSGYPGQGYAGGPGPAGGYPVEDYERGRKARGGAGRYLVLALSVAAVLGLGTWAYFSLFQNRLQEPEQVAVPNVIGMTYEDAGRTLQGEGLQVERAEDAPNDQYDKGVVFKQDPAFNAQAEEGSVVSVTVSAGSDSVEVPSLTGKSQDAARAILADLNLQVGRVSVRDDYKVTKDTVIKTMPAAGHTVKPGSSVELVVSSGNVALQDFRKKDYREAKEWLEEHKLVPRIEFVDREAEPGTVLATGRHRDVVGGRREFHPDLYGQRNCLADRDFRCRRS
ncbi:MAG: serine/threonine protein kinase [Micrococcales bacterium]|nr:MAG: serine/threonine protein kinase [Micrococcales bacterium]